MHSTLNPKPFDDPHDVVVVAPDAVRVAPSDEELSNLLHLAARHRSDTQARAASDVPAAPTVPPVDATFRPAAVNDLLMPRKRWSMASRVVRPFIALLLAGCIGVAAIAWRSYGDTAKKQIAKLTTQLVMTVSEKPGSPTQPATPAVQAAVTEAAPAQPAPVVQTAAEAAAPTAASSADSAQSMARDLAALGQEVEQLKASMEQLKASQQQMSRDVAKASEARTSDARASEQNLRPRISAPPPRSAAAPARRPTPTYPPRQAATAHTSPQAAAPYMPPPPEPPQQAAAQPPPDPELASVPRPPMPVR